MSVLPTIIHIVPGPGVHPSATGACNIGPSEIKRRRLAGILGLSAAVALGVVLLATGAHPLLRLVVVLPLWGGLIGFLQARRRLCVAFAMAGVENLGDDASGMTRVSGDARAASRAAANRILRDALLAAAPAAAAFALLPLG